MRPERDRNLDVRIQPFVEHLAHDAIHVSRRNSLEEAPVLFFFQRGCFRNRLVLNVALKNSGGPWDGTTRLPDPEESTAADTVDARIASKQPARHKSAQIIMRL